MPDFYTLYVVALLLGLSHCIVWGMILYRYPDLAAARYWLAGGAAGVAGGATLATQGAEGLILQTVLGNAFVILGFYINWLGLLRFDGRPPQVRAVVILWATSVLLMIATFYPLYGENPIYTLAQAAPLVLSAQYLFRRRPRELGAIVAAAAMAMATVSHAAIGVGNILLASGWMPDLSLMYAAAIDLLIFLFAAVVWNFGFIISSVDRLRGQVERLANEDELTGLANRRRMMNALCAICVSGQSRSAFALMLFDLDRFKSLNDTYGHAAGDAALTHVAAVVGSRLRRNDMFARFGGDEFCLLLPDTNEAAAIAIAKTLTSALVRSPLEWNGLALSLTASVGVVTSQKTSGEQADDVLEKADQALYETKRRGRNGYTLYSDGLVANEQRAALRSAPARSGTVFALRRP